METLNIFICKNDTIIGIIKRAEVSYIRHDSFTAVEMDCVDFTISNNFLDEKDEISILNDSGFGFYFNVVITKSIDLSNRPLNNFNNCSFAIIDCSRSNYYQSKDLFMIDRVKIGGKLKYN